MRKKKVKITTQLLYESKPFTRIQLEVNPIHRNPGLSCASCYLYLILPMVFTPTLPFFSNIFLLIFMMFLNIQLKNVNNYMQFMNVSVLPYLWPLLYLKSQDEKDPQSVKASIKVTKRSYFNKIRFRLPSSRSNMVSTPLQIETDLVSLDKVWKGKHSKKTL